MSKVLFITANPKSVESSISLGLGEKFLKHYKETNHKDEVVLIDLYKTNIPEIDYELLYVIENMKKGISLENLPVQTRNQFERFNSFTEQFVQADKYIFVTPMWNLGFPARLKSYIDTICIAGKTFRYTPDGPQGLLKDKKCLHIHASGGFHSKDPMNHADKYLKDIMQFMGVADYKSIVVEGHSAIPDRAETIIAKAHTEIPAVVEWFAV
ncbi:MAG: FMN-dependent NADH-azoreductase [Bacillota bacterium]|nr:FMN-dependent NADH-azoreductase [Bacillota bacterium]